MPPVPPLDPDDATRVAGLVSQMTREEKIAQLVGLWVMVDPMTGEVTPYEGTFVASYTEHPPIAEQMRHGLGEVTRALGSAPITAIDGARIINEVQRRLVED